ncbi:MAG: tetratricopeptide repeat protein, partial [Chloroflexota bacterium]
VLSFNNMGYVLRDLEKYEASKSYYEEALDINLTIFGEIHPKTAVSLINLGDVKIKLKAHEEAKVDLNRAQDIYVVMQDGKHFNVANINFNLGVIAEDESNLDEAMAFFGQALHIRQSKLGDAHPQTVRTKKRLQQVIKKRAS